MQTQLTPLNRFANLTSDNLNDLEQQAVIDLARRVLAKRHTPGKAFTKPELAASYFQLHLAEKQFEVFAILFLDTQHRILAFEELFNGTIDGSVVYPRVVAQRALALNAAAVIAAHNHPSGITRPSNADQTITKKLNDALKLLDIRLLDHFIVSAEGTYSFAEHGLI